MRAAGVLLALFGLACDRDPSTDARMFLDRLEQIDLDDPPEPRRRLVDSLASLPLAHEEVRAAREICVEAHRRILEAEDLQARARNTLARYGEHDVPSAEDRVLIQRSIRSADHALERSRDLFQQCHRRSQELGTRYRRKRR